MVGAGGAGAALAARLAAGGDPVLLLEAGPDFTTAETTLEVRGRDFHGQDDALARHPELWWPDLFARRTPRQPPSLYKRGRGVGGTSTIDAMMSIRGVVEDYDGMGASGWSFAELLPTFRRLESDLDYPNSPWHGAEGPIPIHREPESGWGSVDRAFAESVTDLGYGWAPDHNEPGTTGGSPYGLNVREGLRVSTNDAYLEPLRGHPNLTIAVGALVDRVLFDRLGAAAGVRLADGREHRIDAGGEVVLSAGSVHSPAILLRSGVGPAANLKRLDIRALADLPVGLGLQDHAVVPTPFSVDPGATAGAGNRRCNACLRFSSSLEGAGSNDLFMISVNSVFSTQGSIGLWLNRAFSTGRLALASADPTVNPVIDLRLLSDARDRTRLLEGLERVREVAEHGALARLRTGLLALPEADRLDELVREGYHMTSTCRMGAENDPRSVVDARCRVIGVRNLRVADASVMPEVPRANTFLSSVIIGERVAELTG